MKISILLCTLFLTTSAFAQVRQPRAAQERQVQRMVDQISNLTPTHLSSLNQRELDLLLTQLTSARNTLLGSGTTVPPTRPIPPLPPTRPVPTPDVNLLCVARDNDNRAPWVYSYVNENFNVIKITSVLFASINACEENLRNQRRTLGVALSCTSRDGDNRAPYNMIKFQGANVNKLTTQNFASLNSCFDVLDRARVIGHDELAFCIDRDADNRAPYVMKKLDVVQGVFSNLNNTTFPNMNECERILYSR